MSALGSGAPDPRREVDAEVEDYLQRRTQELVGQGLDPDTARRRALEAFGDVDAVRDRCTRLQLRRRRRDAATRAVVAAVSELRAAARRVLRRPAFFGLASATLALGVGANTALFSVVDGVLLRPLPFPQPERLVQVWESDPNRPRRHPSPADYLDLRREATSFERLSAYDWATGNLLGVGEPERLGYARVAADFFATLGVGPALGAGFGPGTVREGEWRAVLSDGLWRRRFGGDPNAVGRTLRIDEVTYEVVGVMPPGFVFPGDVSLWVAAPHDVPAPPSFPDVTSMRDAWFHRVVGRLAPGTGLEGARAEMRTLAARLAAEHPEPNAGLGIELVPLHEQLVGPVRSTLHLLLGATALVLLVACANVANLLLVRASESRAELAVRRALGAGRARVVAHVAADGAVLGVAGAAAGSALATAIVALVRPMLADVVPPGTAVVTDARVLAYSLVVALATALAFAVVPALVVTRDGGGGALADAARGRAGGAGPGRARELLTAAEAGLALVLVVGAVLMVRSLRALGATDLGFEEEGLVFASVGLPGAGAKTPAERLLFFDEVARRVSALPGVTSVGWTQQDPLSSGPAASLRGVDMSFAGERGELLDARWQVVDAGYFDVLGAPIVAGRGLEPTDRAGSEPVALVNETLVRTGFGDVDPLGRLVNTGLDGREEDGGWRWVRIVGVVADTRNRGPVEPVQPAIYRPMGQGGPGFRGGAAVLAVRVVGDGRALLPALRAEVWAVDDEAPVYDVRSGSELALRYGATPRLVLTLLGGFAAVALVLGWVGIWGVTAYAVSRRTRELGVRLALGAPSGRVVRHVVATSLPWTAGGLLAGIALAAFGARFLRGMLVGVAPLDPTTFLLVPLVLLAAATVATWAPARRAGRVDPVRAMRAE